MPSMRTKRRVFSRKRVWNMRKGDWYHDPCYKHDKLCAVTFGYMLWRGKTIKDMKLHKKLYKNFGGIGV